MELDPWLYLGVELESELRLFKFYKKGN